MKRWKRMRSIRLVVNEAIEPLRSQKIIRSSLEADVDLSLQAQDYEWFDEVLFAEVAIVARVRAHGDYDHPGDIPAPVAIARVAPTENHKCGRCWRHLPEVPPDGGLCNRYESSEERREGNECVRTGSSRWEPDH